MVGLNRRFYSIFNKGKKIIKKNGKLLGITIEGHERFWKIKNRLNNNIKNHWGYANCIHTIDLLRFFGGEFKNVYSLKSKYVENNGDQFISVMKSNKGVLCTYISHWYSPEGWSVRLFGEKITAIYKPLENGVWIDNNFRKHKIIPDKVDTLYKPGFFYQMDNFKKMILNKKLEWPGQSLIDSYQSMLLVYKILQLKN